MLRNSYVAGNGLFLIRKVTLGQRVTTIRYTLRPSATPWDVAPAGCPGPRLPAVRCRFLAVKSSGRNGISWARCRPGIRSGMISLTSSPGRPPRPWRLTWYVLAPVIRGITAGQNIIFLLEVTRIQRKGGSGGGRRRNPVWPPLRFAVYLATQVTPRTPSCPAAIASAAFGAASSVGGLPIARGKIS
jgi:hypothetical protein